MSRPNNLLEFPCSFPLKAIGKNTDGFETFVVNTVRKHVPELSETAISSRSSTGDKYLSVTVTFMAQSQTQLDALYREFSGSERILMLF
jgi:putative lipoic acid-binding regulatory protein